MHAISLHYMYYNFARIHKTLRVTPAMEAGSRITSGRWKKLRLFQTEPLPTGPKAIHLRQRSLKWLVALLSGSLPRLS